MTVCHVLTTRGTYGYYQFSESTSLFAGNVDIKTSQYVCFELYRKKTEGDFTRSANGGLLILILFLTSNRDTLAMLTFLSLAARSRTQLNRGLHLTQLQITIKGGERGIQRRE